MKKIDLEYSKVKEEDFVNTSLQYIDERIPLAEKELKRMKTIRNLDVSLGTTSAIVAGYYLITGGNNSFYAIIQSTIAAGFFVLANMENSGCKHCSRNIKQLKKTRQELSDELTIES